MTEGFRRASGLRLHRFSQRIEEASVDTIALANGNRFPSGVSEVR